LKSVYEHYQINRKEDELLKKVLEINKEPDEVAETKTNTLQISADIHI
jgi:hypothetical protein